MFSLLKIEFYKLKRFPFGYIAVIFMFVVGYVYGDNRIGTKIFDIMDNTNVVFSDTVHDTSFVFFISIVLALFMGKDFSNRTICNEIKLGYGRFHILLSRMIVVCAFAALLHVIYIMSAVLGFSMWKEFDASMFCVENVLWLLTVLIQLAGVINGVILISFITRKMSEAIALSAMYAFVCCNILRNYMRSKMFTLSCFYFVQKNNPENLIFSGISALVTMVVFLTIAAFTFRKAEVK